MGWLGKRINGADRNIQQGGERIRDRETGFRIKSGMTKYVRLFGKKKWGQWLDVMEAKQSFDSTRLVEVAV